MNEMNYQYYDVIEQVFKAIEEENLNQAQECLDDNFKAVVLKTPLSRDEYLEVYRRIKEGLPDAKFYIKDLTSNGDTFKANIRVCGTHTHTIPSLKRGWKSLKPTGKKINKVLSSVEITLRGNRILEIRHPDENFGLVAGLLNELNLLPKNYSLN